MKKSLKGGVKGGHSLVAPNYGENHIQQSDGDSKDGLEYWPKGFTNVGNTCYANAALQCLLSTSLTTALLDPRTVPILRRYSSNPTLLALGSGSVDSADNGKHYSSEECENEQKRKERERRRIHENCEWLTEELTNLTHAYTEENAVRTQNSVMGWLSQPDRQNGVVDPGNITKHPDRLSKCLRPYQQEDAHEFLRALLGTLVMNGHNKKLSSLFDGLLESAVTCRTCGRESLTRDRYMDLSLDINDPDICTLDDALYEFTKTEILEDDNAVFCSKCKKKRSVTKGLRLATAPSILVCHLKRFAFDHFGRLVRLHKKIDFPLRLQIGEFMSNLNKARPPPYDLVGILVHQGQTCASGHYVAFVKKDGEWFKCNDSVVTKVDEATVLDQQAYIMMYEVAEMRARTCTPRSKVGKQTPELFLDEDDAEMSKDDYSTHAQSSYSTREHVDEEARTSVDRLLNFLYEAEAPISRFLDLCCAADSVNEPRTTRMKRNRRRARGSSVAGDSTSTAQDFRRNLSGLNVIEGPRKRNKGFRSQTAPRQRTQSEDYNANPFDVDSPRTSYSARSSRQQGQKAKSKKEKTRSMLAGNSELPPLPTTPGRRRRAKSSASARRKDAYMIV